MKTKISTLSKVLIGLIITSANAVSYADTGPYSDTYYQVSASGTVNAGDAIDYSSPLPYTVDTEGYKFKANCYFRIDSYNSVQHRYKDTVACQGINGWEIASFNTTSLYDLNDGSIGNSWYWFQVTPTDSTHWIGNSWEAVDNNISIEFEASVKFTAVMKSGALTDVKYWNQTNTWFWVKNSTNGKNFQSGARGKLSLKYVPTSKVNKDAAACFAEFDANAAGDKLPCDPPR